jgi:hypothetical protein
VADEPEEGPPAEAEQPAADEVLAAAPADDADES